MNASIPGRRRGIGCAALRVTTLAGMLALAACAGQQKAEDTGSIFYPPLPELPRIQFLTTINTEQDIGGGQDKFRQFLLGLPEQTGTLVRPFDVAHEKGKIYVVDARFAAIVILDLAERKFEYIRDQKGGPLSQPVGIFVTKDRYKYIADKERGQIVVYNERNEFFRTYGSENQFQPTDVAVDGDRVYVCDVRDNEIEVLDRESGNLVAKIGEPGQDEGQLFWPTHLTLDKQGNVYVTDFLNFRIQKFDRNGNYLKSFGELGTFPGAMPRPKGIAVDDDGYVYAVDVAFELVQVYSGETAEVLLGFAKFGPAPGGSWLPAGVHLDYDNLEYFARYVDPNFKPKYLIYVANQAGERKLNVYAFGDWIGPPPAGAKTASGSGS